jgi:anti-sigma factor RsiW
MKCQKVHEKLDAYVARELPPGKAQRLENHLKTCPACREALVGARRIAAVLSETQAPPLPDGFADRVVSRARRRVPAVERKHAVAPPWSRFSTLAWRSAVAAGVVVGLALGAIMGRDVSEPSQVGASVRDAVVETYQLDYFAEAPGGSVADGMIQMMGLPENAE